MPKSEQYGLTSQIRRAAVAVPSNLAEGQGRGGTRDFLRFIGISYGSLMEVHTQLLIAERLGYQEQGRTQKTEQLVERVAKMLNGLRRSLRTKLDRQNETTA